MAFEERRVRTDRMMAADAGLKIGDNERVVFLPKSGDPQVDESQIRTHYGEYFDTAKRTEDGIFMTRPVEAEQALTKRYQDESKAGCHAQKAEYSGKEQVDEEDEEVASAQPMMASDPDTLKAHQFLTVD
jgi:cytochrome oxidase Cu insertion factor (SCO1/SenC/PrrC family)